MRALITQAIATAFKATAGLQSTVTLQRHTKTVSPVDGSVTAVVVSQTADALVQPIDAGMIARGEVRAEDAPKLKKYLIQAASLAGTDPDYFDVLVDGSKSYKIKSVFNPSGALWVLVASVMS